MILNHQLDPADFGMYWSETNQLEYMCVDNLNKNNNTMINNTTVQNVLPSIEGIRISDVEVTYKGKLDPDTSYWGAVTVRRDGREFIWDVRQAYTNDLRNGHYRTSLELVVYPDVFSECKYDLTREDMLNPTSATLYYEGINTSEFMPTIELWFTDLKTPDVNTNEPEHYQCIELQAD